MENSKTNMEVIEEQHKKYYLLPKLPYLVNPNKVVVLSLDDNSLNYYKDNAKLQETLKENVSDFYFNYLEPKLNGSRSAAKDACKAAEDKYFDMEVSLDEVEEFINGLDEKQFENLLVQMETYYNLQFEK